jgi:hypothetical protein
MLVNRPLLNGRLRTALGIGFLIQPTSAKSESIMHEDTFYAAPPQNCRKFCNVSACI